MVVADVGEDVGLSDGRLGSLGGGGFLLPLAFDSKFILRCLCAKLSILWLVGAAVDSKRRVWNSGAIASARRLKPVVTLGAVFFPWYDAVDLYR